MPYEIECRPVIDVTMPQRRVTHSTLGRRPVALRPWFGHRWDPIEEQPAPGRGGGGTGARAACRTGRGRHGSVTGRQRGGRGSSTAGGADPASAQKAASVGLPFVPSMQSRTRAGDSGMAPIWWVGRAPRAVLGQPQSRLSGPGSLSYPAGETSALRPAQLRRPAAQIRWHTGRRKSGRCLTAQPDSAQPDSARSGPAQAQLNYAQFRSGRSVGRAPDFTDSAAGGAPLSHWRISQLRGSISVTDNHNNHWHAADGQSDDQSDGQSEPLWPADCCHIRSPQPSTQVTSGRLRPPRATSVHRNHASHLRLRLVTPGHFPLFPATSGPSRSPWVTSEQHRPSKVPVLETFPYPPVLSSPGCLRGSCGRGSQAETPLCCGFLGRSPAPSSTSVSVSLDRWALSVNLASAGAPGLEPCRLAGRRETNGDPLPRRPVGGGGGVGPLRRSQRRRPLAQRPGWEGRVCESYLRA